MHRFHLLLPALLLSIISTAQDWAPVFIDKNPQYTLEGTDSIVYSAKVDSVYSAGSAQIYFLHPAYTSCDSCLSDPPCADLTLVRKINALGDSIKVSSDTITMYGIDLLIITDAIEGSTYEYSLDGIETITATVVSAGIQNIFGVLDSIKQFSFSNGLALSLSKNYGVYAKESPTENFTLSGIPELSVGTFYPGFRQFQTFEIGDVLVYMGGDSFLADKSCFVTRLEITNVEIVGDSIFYTYDRAYSSSSFTAFLFSSSDGYAQNLTMAKSLRNPVIEGIIPGMVVTIDENENPYFLAEPSNYFGHQGIVMGESLENYFSYPAGPLLLPYYCTLQSQGTRMLTHETSCFELPEENFAYSDTLYSYTSVGFGLGFQVSFEYADGLGMVSRADVGPESWSFSRLAGFRKDGQDHGQLYTVSQILSANDMDINQAITLYPNPSDGQVSILAEDVDVRSVQIVDVMGRVVFEQRGSFLSKIEVEKLVNGIYLVHINTTDGLVVKKLVIE